MTQRPPPSSGQGAESEPPLTYSGVGIDFEARANVVERYKDVSKRASRPEVLGGIGPFAGLFALGNKYRDPVIVASTDGVGTKVKLAALAGRYEDIGHDIVYACVNDLLTTGAEPLFFLDYIGSDGLPQEAKVSVVKGIADACAGLGMALLGGETADMPGVYPPGEFDLVGFVVGVVEREALIDGTKIVAGDLLFALPSNGLHTNGYSLVRPALNIAMDASQAEADRRRLERYEEELGETLADALLRPHEDYVGVLRPAISSGVVKGLSHITGGGLEENIPRILPASLGARFRRGGWDVPPVFPFVQRAGSIEGDEMFRVFNMGLGMVIAVAPGDAGRLLAEVPAAFEVGVVVPEVEVEPRVGWQ